MRTLILAFLLILFSPLSEAQICGYYRIDDFGQGNTRLALIDFRSKIPVTYTIANASDPAIATLTDGICYCAEGAIGDDDHFMGDSSMKTIMVQTIVRSRNSCGRTPAPRADNTNAEPPLVR